MKAKIIKIKDVFFDKKLYPRSNIRFFTVSDYAQALKTGAKFPPIVVAKLGKRHYLVDGAHRIEANKRNKNKYIQAQILTNLNKNQIYVESIKRNIHHGYQLSNYEKTKIIVRLKDIGYDLPQISKIINVPVRTIENRVARTVTSSITGEPIVLKQTVKHLKNTEISETPEEFEDTTKRFRGESQVSLLDDILHLLNLGYLDLEDSKVKERLRLIYFQLNKIFKKKGGKIKSKKRKEKKN